MGAWHICNKGTARHIVTLCISSLLTLVTSGAFFPLQEWPGVRYNNNDDNNKRTTYSDLSNDRTHQRRTYSTLYIVSDSDIRIKWYGF
ncbi:hypothetical protein LY76DRAFT_338667 [Colletotrichum caudatum]|nr:hypothetical protein LY76DRAFT_338667 [Colletotrichum caudatum]